MSAGVARVGELKRDIRIHCAERVHRPAPRVEGLAEVAICPAALRSRDQVLALRTTRRFAITAPSPHCHATWLLPAGRLFADNDHRQQPVLDIVDRFDSSASDWPGTRGSPRDDVLAATERHLVPERHAALWSAACPEEIATATVGDLPRGLLGDPRPSSIVAVRSGNAGI
ncbi:hypothetical protein G3I59_27975 [Amycolatopsis rubida]|uniref:Uncharacterized protein n=1 Tax=Amycolatopsis rubida TaxID=112413 RepID=A0ABX0C2Q9_9PSEU|nr:MULTISPECIES: hypothetical protein [Amycolatopsis]MYW94331.1 hypothetical protein [Amycolatopsis rubida]NEC59320.1 hypothetical protein [Amycolatopsis rubida]